MPSVERGYKHTTEEEMTTKTSFSLEAVKVEVRELREQDVRTWRAPAAGTSVSFTGTQVQILTLVPAVRLRKRERLRVRPIGRALATSWRSRRIWAKICFGNGVMASASRCSVYVLYQYKGTNTDKGTLTAR